MQIRTKRLLLRPAHELDFDSARAIWMDPEVRTYSGGPPDEELFRTYFFQDLEHAAGDYGFKSVIDLATGLHVGDAGLIQKRIEGRDEVEVLYFFAKAVWGRGFATEAARALVDHAFTTLDLERVVALIHTDNHASMRVAERTGLVFEREVATDSGNLRKLFARQRSPSGSGGSRRPRV